LNRVENIGAEEFGVVLVVESPLLITFLVQTCTKKFVYKFRIDNLIDLNIVGG